MDLEIWELVVLAVVGIIAGCINALAGGGSLITLPVLTFFGIDGAVANGTNRIGLIAQNTAAIATYIKKGFKEFKLSITLGLCTLPGTIVGAICGSLTKGDTFKIILSIVMIGVVALMLLKKKAKKKPIEPDNETVEEEIISKKRLIIGHLLMSFVGFYGGFIQAGLGFILIPILSKVMGMSLVRTNQHKVFIVWVFMPVSFLVYLLQGDIAWLAGVALAIGMSIGGYIGANLNLKKGDGFILKILTVAVIGMVIKMLYPLIF